MWIRQTTLRYYQRIIRFSLYASQKWKEIFSQNFDQKNKLSHKLNRS